MASVLAYEGDDGGESGEGENTNDIHGNKPQFHHRKRKKSIHNTDGSYVPPYKKNRFRRQVSVLPSKFLLGGNIRDPLNLASLADAKVNAEVNKATPTSSPLSVPSGNHQQGQIPVFIPKNPDDPLGLSVPSDNPEDIIAGVRTNKHKKRHRRRHGRKRTDSECSVGTDTLGEEEEDGEEDRRKELKECNRTLSQSSHKTKPVDIEKERDKNSENDSQQQHSVISNLKEKILPSPTTTKGSKPETVPDTPPTVVEIEKNVDKGRKKKPTVQENVRDAKPVKVEAETSSAKEEKVVEGQSKETSVPMPEATDSKETPKANEDDAQQSGSGPYPCKSSEYVPLSSSYAPSPFIFDTMNPEDGFEVKPFESPSLTNYYCNALTPSHLMEPFSPPPRPEIPHFQRRMQNMVSSPPPPRPHNRHPAALSLQRAVFQKPFYRRRFRHRSDPIVSPVIPQPGCSNRRNHHHHHGHRHNNKKNDKQQNNSLNTSTSSATSTHSATSKKGSAAKAKQSNILKPEITATFRSKDEVYQFGNYKQYYGYRTPDGDDSRLWVLKKEWFRDKDVLDIGCNIGHVTLSIARDFEARRVHGIDIDNNLITTARKNIKHYMIHDPSDKTVVFPHSLPMIYGAMQPPTGVGMMPQQFPFNVMFSQENYVLSNDALLESVKPEYDVIICLSVTKWIHLNFGDDGMKRFFQRTYRHLRKGGKLILEPQEWSSYYRKRKLTAKISENYKRITFLPEQFQDYLVNNVGFTFTQRLGTPHHHSKGFQRPLLIFSKDSKGNSPATEDSSATTTTTLDAC